MPVELAHADRHIRILADAASTGGAETVLEISAARGSGLPRHLHRIEDELLWVSEGVLRVTVDGDPPTELLAGDTLLLPRGVPHEVRVASERAHWTVVCQPAGIEWFLHATASDDGLPLDVHDDDVAAHLAAAGIRVLASRAETDPDAQAAAA